MSNGIQISPIAPAPVRPAQVKRAPSAAPQPQAAAVDAVKQPATHVESSQPIEPVVTVEPKTRLTIAKDEVANTFVYRSLDAHTGEIVWQYPVEQVLRMAHRLRELEGLDAHQVDEKV